MIAAAVLGSGIAFLDSSVVNTALPRIRATYGTTLSGQQWVVTGYLLTLGSLLVVGGALGDIFGRRKTFVFGLVGFSLTSVMCGLAPNISVLIIARVFQGAAAALLVPGSMAMLSAVFHPDDRATAIGAWAGLASVSTALGPFLGGWLIDSVSWRWIFLINPFLAAIAVVIAQRSVPESRGESLHRTIDLGGAAALSVGLAGLVYALIEGPERGWSNRVVGCAVAGLILLALFVVIEMRTSNPMVPLGMFRSKRFAGTNAATFVMWGAIGAVFFLLTILLQNDLGYSALEAGAATLPITVLMALFASRSGALAQRVGVRAPLIVGPAVTAGAFALLSRISPGSRYGHDVFPPLVLFGFGLVLTVAPLTATVLASVDQARVGVGSAINNAVARVASLLAIAVLPAVSGMSGSGGTITEGFAKAMWICAALTLTASVISALTITQDQAV